MLQFIFSQLVGNVKQHVGQGTVLIYEPEPEENFG